MKYLLIVLIFFSCLFLKGQDKVTLKKEDNNNVKVFINDQLFTEYINGEQKPFLFPVIGPDGTHMTRNYPMNNSVAEETKDHPWQSSLYFAHGSVNGNDFWNDSSEKQKNTKIVLDKVISVENISPEIGKIVATHQWQVDGKTILTDSTEIQFSGNDQKRMIDYKITLLATEGDVLLGDNKEGCMAIRMHHKFQSKDMGAKVVNSEGVKGIDVWGKKARWITYSNEFNGKTLGITMMDFPENLRYPTTWHARDYGLCAANPFGISHFTKNKNNKGDFTIKKGESLTLKYRFIFHLGSAEEAQIEKLHKEWIEQK